MDGKKVLGLAWTGLGWSLSTHSLTHRVRGSFHADVDQFAVGRRIK